MSPLLPAHSAKATTAQEAGFRIQCPNHLQRWLSLVNLDGAGSVLDQWLQRSDWQQLHCYYPDAAGETLRDAQGQVVDWHGWLKLSTVIILAAASSNAVDAAKRVIERIEAGQRLTTIVMLEPEGSPNPNKSALLRMLRPYANMLIVTDDWSYATEMLTAMRA